MKSFTLAAALAAVMSHVNAVKVCSTLDFTNVEYPDLDCGLPEWGLPGLDSIFGPSGTAFDRHTVTTSDGYELTMIRVTDTFTDGDILDPFAEAGSLGPVLL